MKRILYAIIGIATFWPASTFSQSSNTFTLDQCIEYALANAISVQNATLDERIASARVKEIVGMGLPQINGDFSINHNNKLRRFFTTYDTNSFFFSDPAARIPGANNGDVVASQNFFQLKSSADAGLRIDQLIFNGSYLVGIQATKAFKELNQKASLKTRADAVEVIKKAFYLALINRERMKQFDNNISRVDSLFRNTKALFQNGFAESIDVDRIEVQYNNLVTERANFSNLQVLSVELLKFQMNYPMDQILEISGDIEGLEAEVNPDDYIKEWDYDRRPEFQVLEANRKMQALNVRNNYAMGMPVLSAFANLGYATQSSNVGELFSTKTGFKDTGFVGPDKWYSYSLFGVSMSVPVFSGLQRNYKIQQEKLTLQKIENGSKSLKAGFDLEIKQAATSYQNSLKSLQAQKRNRELAAKVARVTKIKYDQGVGSNLEVVEAETGLRDSQVNYYNALYDLQVAKVNLDKAFGLLVKPAFND